MMPCEMDRASTASAICLNFVRPEDEVHVVLWNAIDKVAPQPVLAQAVAEGIVRLVVDENRLGNDRPSPSQRLRLQEKRLLDPDDGGATVAHMLQKDSI